MLVAALRDTPYKIVLFLHIVAVLVSIAPAVAHPILFAIEKRRTDGDVVALSSRVAEASRIYAIALVIAGVIGFGLISMSDKAFKFGDTWVWLSILVWLALNGLLHGVMIPAEKALGAGDRSAEKKIDSVGPVLGIMVLVIIFLMTVKPGGSVL